MSCYLIGIVLALAFAVAEFFLGFWKGILDKSVKFIIKNWSGSELSVRQSFILSGVGYDGRDIIANNIHYSNEFVKGGHNHILNDR